MTKKRKIISILWMCLAFSLIALLVMANRSRSKANCAGIKIEILGDNKIVFIDENNIRWKIIEQESVVGKPLEDINLKKLEKTIAAYPAIFNVRLFFDNQNVLNVKVKERDPIARVFTLDGNSFFIDTAAVRIPQNDNVVIRVPVFTSFPSSRKQLSRPDSTLLSDVRNIAIALNSDSLWQSFVSNVNINRDGTFEIIPVIGDIKIELGGAENLDQKLNKIYSFYKQVIPKVGLNYYDTLDLRYRYQVVATQRNFINRDINVIGNKNDTLTNGIHTSALENQKIKKDSSISKNISKQLKTKI